MKKNNNVIFGIIAVIIIIVLCIVSPMLTDKATATGSKKSEDSVLERATKEANEISENVMKDFNKIDVDTFINLYEGEETSVVLVGRKGCKYCTIAEPIIRNLMFVFDFDINYVSTDDFTQESYEKFSSSNAMLKSFSTPLLMIVSNSEITDHISGLVDTESYVKFFIDNGIINE